MMKIKMTMKMKMNDAKDMEDVETVKEKEKHIFGLMSLPNQSPCSSNDKRLHR